MIVADFFDLTGADGRAGSIIHEDEDEVLVAVVWLGALRGDATELVAAATAAAAAASAAITLLKGGFGRTFGGGGFF